MPRSVRVLDREPEEMGPLLLHPAQVAAEETIAGLITDLRALDSDEELYEFQRELFAQLYDVEEARSNAKRQARLGAKGKPVGSSESGLGWALEEVMWARICRQLRSVGDALAWRLLGYNRRAILALSRNTAAGPMYGKAGLPHELGAVVEAWKNDGEFALLHDLTNCLRIGDLTYFTSEGPRIGEVKSKEATGSRAKQQVKRAQEAVDVANGHGLLGGTVRMLASSRPLVTLLDKVEPVLAATIDHGVVARRIADRQAVHAFTVTAVDKITEDQIPATIQRLTDDAFWMAGLKREHQHHLQGHRLDLLDRGVHNAPYTIFPWAPQVVAALTTDRLAHRHTVAYDRLADRFGHHGMHVTCLLPEETGEIPEDIARLVDPVSGMQVRLDVGVLDRLLYEFIDVDLLVDSVTDQIRGGAKVGDEIITMFANEADVWA